MRYSFHPDAQKELLKAIDYYEECRSNLGLEFAKEVYSTIQRIIAFPLAWSDFSINTKRCLTNRFPFAVVYQIESDEIIIIAIVQLNRKPGYWKKRLK
jgi:hypothetical protein